MTFAIGKWALAICKRCGFQTKYRELLTEWNGQQVCRKCFEEKHPQLTPGKTPVDAIALHKPSPEQKMPLYITVGYGHVFPPWNNLPTEMRAYVGEVTVETP